MEKCGFGQVFSLVDKCQHLFVLCDNEVLDLLRELLKADDEVSSLVCGVYLGKFRHLRLARSRNNTALELRLLGEHTLA